MYIQYFFVTYQNLDKTKGPYKGHYFFKAINYLKTVENSLC